jgi:hypothetical protein
MMMTMTKLLDEGPKRSQKVESSNVTDVIKLISVIPLFTLITNLNTLQERSQTFPVRLGEAEEDPERM